MIKKIAWETFKNTGNINTYLELKQIESIEGLIETKEKGLIDNQIKDNIEQTKIDVKNDNL